MDVLLLGYGEKSYEVVRGIRAVLEGHEHNVKTPNSSFIKEACFGDLIEQINIHVIIIVGLSMVREDINMEVLITRFAINKNIPLFVVECGSLFF